MKNSRWLEAGAFIALFVLFVRAWIKIAPQAPFADLSNPAYFAVIAATLVLLGLVAARLFPSPSLTIERLLLALFLGGMPVIYLWAVLLAGDRSALPMEVVGLVVFVALAIIGYRRSVLVLGLGIVLHGLAWDAWHHNHAPYISAWYPIACLIMDLGFGLLAAGLHLASRQPRQPSVAHA